MFIETKQLRADWCDASICFKLRHYRVRQSKNSTVADISRVTLMLCTRVLDSVADVNVGAWPNDQLCNSRPEEYWEWAWSAVDVRMRPDGQRVSAVSCDGVLIIFWFAHAYPARIHTQSCLATIRYRGRRDDQRRQTRCFVVEHPLASLCGLTRYCWFVADVAILGIDNLVFPEFVIEHCNIQHLCDLTSACRYLILGMWRFYLVRGLASNVFSNRE